MRSHTYNPAPNRATPDDPTMTFNSLFSLRRLCDALLTGHRWRTRVSSNHVASWASDQPARPQEACVERLEGHGAWIVITFSIMHSTDMARGFGRTSIERSILKVVPESRGLCASNQAEARWRFSVACAHGRLFPDTNPTALWLPTEVIRHRLCPFQADRADIGFPAKTHVCAAAQSSYDPGHSGMRALRLASFEHSPGEAFSALRCNAEDGPHLVHRPRKAALFLP